MLEMSSKALDSFTYHALKKAQNAAGYLNSLLTVATLAELHAERFSLRVFFASVSATETTPSASSIALIQAQASVKEFAVKPGKGERVLGLLGAVSR